MNIEKLEVIQNQYLEAMDGTDPFDPLMSQAVRDLETLNRVALSHKESEPEPDVIKKKDWLQAATAIGSILLVLNFERAGVIASKAFTMATRFRV